MPCIFADFWQKNQVPTSTAATAASGSEGVRDAMRTNYMDRLIEPSVWQCQSLGRFLKISSYMCFFCTYLRSSYFGVEHVDGYVVFFFAFVVVVVAVLVVVAAVLVE